jgi:V/A-type H+-transporting ATPase subunit I
MTIVALEKVTFYGVAAQCHAALDELQRFGQLHLMNLNGVGDQVLDGGLVSTEAREALKFLRTSPIQRPGARRDKDFDAEDVIEKTITNKRLQQELSQEYDLVEKAIRDTTPWGEFELPSQEELRTPLWFYVVPRREADTLDRLNVPYQIVAEDETDLYVVVLSHEELDPPPGKQVELDPRPLSQLQARIEEIAERLEELHWGRAELTRWLPWLQRRLDELDDQAAREWAEHVSLRDEDLFAIQGWVPQESRAQAEAIAERFGLAVGFEQPAVAENPPTLLRNPDQIAGAEGVVTFYMTPGYRTWDPTPIMFVSFSMFFGMIVADAGYGFLLALGLILYWRRLGATAKGSQFRNLLLAIVASTVVYGIMTGSYFGLAPKPGSFLDHFRILDFADRGQMMGLSILIGVSHLTLANLITAWNARGSAQAFGPVGWVLVMLGALGMSTALLDPPAPQVVATLGQWILGAGLLTVLLFSSSRPLNSTRPQDWLGRLLDGVGALTGISKLFGDVLSYLRLFALGLASAQLAVTFNSLAEDMAQSRGLGLLLAALILIVGHGINLVLGLMGGVVHGLRLNCIEFFNWSLTEEGQPFRSYHKKVSA